MSDNATQKIEHRDIDEFLGNGFFMGVGPEQVMMAWGKPKKLKKPELNQQCYFVSDFYLEDKSPWVTFAHSVVTYRKDLCQMLSDFAGQPLLDLSWKRPKLENFEAQFRRVQQEINSGKISKAVPVVFSRAQGSMTKSMRAHAIRNLLNNAVKPIPYGYLTPTEGILGASPEILFSYDSKNNELTTMALAGTRNSELEKQNSLLNDEKEIFEHELVVKGLKEKLKDLGERQCSPTYVWDLGSLSHLRTDIQVELREKPQAQNLFSSLIQKLHPTAALGVAPVQADWRFLKSCDGNELRGRFGAPFGVFHPEGKSQVLVAIRNLQWNEDGLSVGTGCGVVGQSELQNEWRELQLKQQYIFDLLNI